MTVLPPHFQFSCRPVAAGGAVLAAGPVRLTVLTDRLLRLEYSPAERFVDRPSQIVWHRELPVPAYSVARDGDGLTLETSHLRLELAPEARQHGLRAETLRITLLADGVRWHPGQSDPLNLRGTYRTLDGISGHTDLEPGLLSRSGWAVIDDSHSLVFNEDAWPESRPAGHQDLYFLGYGRDYKACLRDYGLIAGRPPLLPRWALGNWWSRYWAYSEAELLALMDDFRRWQVPLAVCIVDMDWHITDVGQGIDGWTGYTWNRSLFPDPDRFLAALRERGLRTALNLHPAQGVRPHEAQYDAMARRLGIDPAEKSPIPFAIADPDFVRAYFELLHHPQETRGVDFWWLDWQQGESSGLAGLDPLWWLNHLHFHDRARDGRRPFIFSRWGGLGNHRYPIGFSGDTYVNWATLAFQPYFTATAANVGYGWWSHDIGGHMLGVEDGELYTRWVQFGVFSPISRLHATKNAFADRRPWAFDAAVLEATRQALQLRHALIPYLYTLSWQNASRNEPPVRPLYHDYPDEEAAYHCPQQYLLGADLLVAPFTAPADPDTRLSRQVVWLPPGGWYDFWDGDVYEGDSWQAVYGGLDRIPVLVRTGAILPLGPMVDWGGVGNPEQLDVRVFTGADHRFELYEDEGEGLAYRDGATARTTFEQASTADGLKFTINPVAGRRDLVPAARRYRLHFHGLAPETAINLQVDGQEQPVAYDYLPATETLVLAPIGLPPSARLQLTLAPAGDSLRPGRDRTAERVLALIRRFRLETATKSALSDRLADWLADPTRLAPFALTLRDAQLRALLEVSQGLGVHRIEHTWARDLLLLWNNQSQPWASYQFSQLQEAAWLPEERFQAQRGVLPRFAAIVPETRVTPRRHGRTPEGRSRWELRVDYQGLLTTVLRGKGRS